jgi:hypothetical protein
MDSNHRFRAEIGNVYRCRAEQRCAQSDAKSRKPRNAASARICATLPQCQAARIVIRHPFNPAPHPQHHWRLALSNDLAHD